MAKRLGIKVIMEGVETQEQRDFLRDLQCDYIQGYFYSKPIPVTEYEDKYIKKVESTYKYTDKNNCERIINNTYKD